VSLKQLQGLDCITVAQKRYLRIDTSIDCDSDEYHTFLVLDALLIVAYLTTPIVWLVVLVSHRRALNPAPTTGSDKSVTLFLREQDPRLRPIRFLFRSYQPSVYYMEVIEMWAT
jgi:hypothetical protein